MTPSFRDFLQQECHMMELTTVDGTPPAMTANWIDPVNEDLAEVLETVMPTPDIGYSRVRGVLEAHNIHLPLSFSTIEGDEGEDVYVLQTPTPMYLYLAYFREDDGQYEFFAEFMDDQTLEDLLSVDESDSAEDSILPT